MTGPDASIAAFTAKQHGLVARWQTRAIGVPDELVDRRVASGILILVHSGVYRLRGVPYTQELRWLAGVLAGGPGAWLSHRAAAAFHEYGIAFTRPEITIAHRRECELDGVVSHRTRRRHDVITMNGIPVTTKERTLLDCAAVMPYAQFELLLQNAVTDGRVKVEAMYAILERRGGRGVPGVVATRLALAGGLVDEKIQKRLELILARLIDACRVPKPVRQHPLVCADGRKVFLDNAWPDRKRAVEAIGLRWHGNAHQAAATRARARSIRATGWDLEEYGWYEATEVPDETRRAVEAFWAGSTSRGVVDPAQNEEGEGAAA